MRRLFLAALVMALAACAAAPVKRALTEEQMKDDYVVAGRLLAPDGWAAAALVRDGKFACVGTLPDCLAQTRPNVPVLDLGRGVAVPGLVDAHGHVYGFGRSLLEVHCEGTRGEEECAARVAERARRAPPGTWIRGRGWNQEEWPASRFPSERSLTVAVPEHPVLLMRNDGHAAWVNEAALAAAGIDAATPDPDGGRILHYPDGRPSGVLVDNAVDLVAQRLAKPAPAELEEGILRALRELLALGLTEVHDAGCDGDTLEAYRRLAEAGRLPIRVYAMIDGQQPMPEVERLMALWKATPEVGRLTVRAVKLYADGALGSRGAAISSEYADDLPGNRGLWMTPPAELRARIEAVARAGFQPAVHAIGDRANAEVLKDFAALAEAGIALEPLRPRLEHAQFLPPEDVHLLKDHWCVASMQPLHAVRDAPWVEKRLGKDSPILAGAYAWKTVLRYGVPLAFGSDFPIESPDPRLGLLAAELRTPETGAPWQPEQRITRLEALRAYTRGAAVAALASGRRGEIRAGQDADLTVFAADPLTVTPRELSRLRVLRVVVGGRTELGGTAAGPAPGPGTQP
ncbi:amidohydrolase [Anaeromyxobacter paludicola]|uniref:Amidohydrolase n=1 Tax=Anaeromyxobacter paludicola TaxID=2918171 RepID=A0ABM7X782_9BACT|nr:amidohydrolase [Anaeromyxobacter paludicola]BDG07700.1 amidohydrolase [Anaeromyxobacter paludicola]